MSDESKSQEEGSSFLRYVIGVVCQLKELAEMFQGIISNICTSIEELKNASAEEKSTLRECIRNLTKLVYKLFEVIDAIDDIFHFWGSDSEHNNMTKENDISDLKDWVDILHRYLSKYEQKYQEYVELEKSLKVETTLDRAITECKKLENAAQNKKAVTQVVGGTAAGTELAVAAVGVPASIVAGIFTFGIGTVVGLAVTGAVAGAAEPVATGVAVIAVSSYNKAIEEFRSLHTKFVRVNSILCTNINNDVLLMHVSAVSFSRVLDNVKIESQRNDGRTRQLLKDLCLLETRGKEFKEKSSIARNFLNDVYKKRHFNYTGYVCSLLLLSCLSSDFIHA